MYEYRYSIHNIIIGYTCVEFFTLQYSVQYTSSCNVWDGWMDARVLVCSSILLDIMILDYRDRASAGGMDIL